MKQIHSRSWFAFALSALLLSIVSFAIHSETADSAHKTVAITHATIYPSPIDSPIHDGVIVLRDGKIVAVGNSKSLKTQKDATVVNCQGMFVTAGFQNSHVHFTEGKWEKAATQSAAQLESQLLEMLTRYGVTTAVDTGSALENTNALRARIQSGEVKGPRILTAGSPLYPPDGIPFYLKTSLPPSIVAQLATPSMPEEAEAIAKKRLDDGADIIKLFTGSWVDRSKVLNMSAAVASAATAEAHKRGKLVFAHASNLAGLEVALQAKVDVLAHALDDDRGWNESHIERMKANRMSMIPTLKLFYGPPYFKYILKEVGDFSAAGGQILFGTDIGYLPDYSPTQEYELMAQAGLSWKQILASLTTAPAERFGESQRRGRIAPGLDADLVVLNADPAADVKAFSAVKYTLRAGRIIYDGSPQQAALLIRQALQSNPALEKRYRSSLCSLWLCGESSEDRKIFSTFSHSRRSGFHKGTTVTKTAELPLLWRARRAPVLPGRRSYR